MQVQTSVPDRPVRWVYTYGNRGERRAETVVRADNADPGTDPQVETRVNTRDAAAQLQTVDSDVGVDVAYGYDSAGRRRLVDRAVGSDTTYTYDPAGRLKITTTGTLIQTRSYSPAGTVDAVDHNDAPDWQQLWWDLSGRLGAPQVLQWQANGVNTAFSYGEDRLTATGIWHEVDWLGSTLNISGPGVGSPVGYDPFGASEPTHSGNLYFGYRGELTARHQLVHLRNRDYDPTTGTFLTPDPLDGVAGTPTEANPYHYADNDPLNKTDPTGMRPNEVCADLWDAEQLPPQSPPSGTTTTTSPGQPTFEEAACQRIVAVLNSFVPGWRVVGPKRVGACADPYATGFADVDRGTLCVSEEKIRHSQRGEFNGTYQRVASTSDQAFRHVVVHEFGHFLLRPYYRSAGKFLREGLPESSDIDKWSAIMGGSSASQLRLRLEGGSEWGEEYLADCLAEALVPGTTGAYFHQAGIDQCAGSGEDAARRIARAHHVV